MHWNRKSNMPNASMSPWWTMEVLSWPVKIIESTSIAIWCHHRWATVAATRRLHHRSRRHRRQQHRIVIRWWEAKELHHHRSTVTLKVHWPLPRRWQVMVTEDPFGSLALFNCVRGVSSLSLSLSLARALVCVSMLPWSTSLADAFAS